MQNLLISVGGIVFVVTLMSLIGNFFDISGKHYLPFMCWIVALFLFNIFLKKDSENIFMKNVNRRDD